MYIPIQIYIIVYIIYQLHISYTYIIYHTNIDIYYIYIIIIVPVLINEQFDVENP